jgi:hypothetical protein
MPKKLVKADYVAIIQNHFSKQNKRLSNVTKMTLYQLKETITRYEIEFDEEKILKENEEADKKNKEKKEKERVEDEEADKKYIEDKERKNKEWKELDDDDQDKVISFMVIKENKIYLDNYFRTQRKNKSITKDVEKLGEKCKLEDAPFEIISEDTINVRGVNIILGFYTEPFDWDKTYNKIKGYLDEYCYCEPLKILEEINKN